jgi:hypothetical protein
LLRRQRRFRHGGIVFKDLCGKHRGALNAKFAAPRRNGIDRGTDFVLV